MNNLGRGNGSKHHSTAAYSVSPDAELFECARSDRPSAPVDIGHLRTMRNVPRVISYAMSLRELEPKQVYGPLGIHKSAWSLIQSGKAEFPASKIVRFDAICGNRALLEWLAGGDGCELRPLKSALELENDELRRENEELRRHHEVIADFVRKTMVSPKT
jgi:hypothetical protein